MTERSSHPTTDRLFPIALGIALLAFAYLAWRSIVPAEPRLLATASSLPQRAELLDGSWYWVESGAAEQLVRAGGSQTVKLASADKIPDFTVSSGRVAWIAREKGAWKLSLSTPEAPDGRVIHMSSNPLYGVLLDGDRVFWIEQIQPVMPAGEPLPPLSSQCRIYSVPVTGGEPVLVATLMEPEGNQIIGVRDRELVLSTFRPGYLGATAIYSVPLDGGSARRIAGVAGRQRALLASDGTLYWLGPSAEANMPHSTSSVQKMSRDGRIETLADWLPYGGRLVETARGIVYVDDTYSSRAWPVASRRELPKPSPLKSGFVVIGAGDGELLVRPIAAVNPSSVPVSRVRLP